MLDDAKCSRNEFLTFVMLSRTIFRYALFFMLVGLNVTINPKPIENIIPAIVKIVDEKNPSGRTAQTELAKTVKATMALVLSTILIITQF